MPKEPSLSQAKRRLLELQRQGRFSSDLTAPSLASGLSAAEAREAHAPLALAQEQVWKLDQIAGKLAPLHNESITIHRHGPCDPSLIERCLLEIIQRHQIWRTTFEVIDGRPRQIVHDVPAGFRLEFSDLRSLAQDEREPAAIALATGDARKPFELERGPLLRARLITLDDARHRLYLTAHQSVVDGITVFDVFPSELTALYEQFAQGKPSPLPALSSQYADFARWQQGRLAEGGLRNQLEYWHKQLEGELPVLQWPNPGRRPPQQTYRGAIYSFKLRRELAGSLKELGKREGATLFMVLLAGWVALLHRYTGQEDIIVGTLAPAGRKRIEFQRCIGYFLNPVALRARLASKPSFGALVRQLRDATIGAISHDDVPLETIAERLALNPDPSRHPLFTVALSAAPDVPQLPPGWTMSYMDVESGGARWDLYLEFSDRAEGLLGRAQYNPDLFTSSEIRQTIEDLAELLERRIAGP